MNLLHSLFYYIHYLSNPPWDTGITPPELAAFVSAHPPGSALDLGCGTGTNVIYLAQHGWKATGVDFVGRAIRQARQKARRAGVDVKLIKEDVTRLRGISGPFELILDIGCFHGLQPARRPTYIKNICRLLHPQGTYLLYAFTRSGEDRGAGLDAADLQALEERLELVERRDGTERGRASAWFTWRKPFDPAPVQ